VKASERIHHSIESQIGDGALLPGDPIDEERLMLQFGVSRTPVREAILRLTAEGLVTRLPRGGTVVAKMDVSQLFAMWELLAELEGLCARYACERMHGNERELLLETHRRAQAIVDRDDEIGWQQANTEFHEILYAGARNPYLRQEILRMRTRTQAYRKHAFGAVGRLRTSYHHHGLIVDAILARNSAAAAKAGLGHLSPGEGAPGVTDLIMNLPKELLG
jgi:DNA-binding GntR family transcriptional regulator